MAVYTELTEDQLRKFANHFVLGELVRAHGIAAGTINTIYDLTTTQGHYILRILEGRTRAEAQFEERLMEHLVVSQLEVPRMLPGRRGGAVLSIGPRQQVSVFEFVEGRELAVFEVDAGHARQIGAFLGRLSQATKTFHGTKDNRFSTDALASMLDQSLAGFDGREHRADLAILATELDMRLSFDGLPTGMTHGDLFVDNARFKQGQLEGVIDFEMASTMPLIYDLAVAIGDWAFTQNVFHPERARALLEGYQEHRVLEPDELSRIFAMMRFSCCRYAISRFFDFELNAQPGVERLYKDYRHFMSRLRALDSLGEPEFFESVLGV